MSVRFREAWSEFWVSGVSKLGVAFLIALSAISIYVLVSYPLDFGLRRWNNPQIWSDNPKAVPPAWTTSFGGESVVEHTTFLATEPTNVTESAKSRTLTYEFSIDYGYDGFPSFTSLSVTNATFHTRAPQFTLFFERPDNATLKLLREVAPAKRSEEEPPVTRWTEPPRRVYLSGDDRVASAIQSFLSRDFELKVSRDLIMRVHPELPLFGVPKQENETLSWEVLKGTYHIRVEAELFDSRDTVGEIKYVLGGGVFGMMGTDSLGRDLAVGLIFGFPVALFIGFVTSTLTTVIGAAGGVASGYLGGKVDLIIQRAADLVYNVPLLPVLIFFTFAVGRGLWVIVVILVAFGWPGLAIIVRSMVLQVRESQFIEAARSLGASRRWIMFRHVFPQVAPYVFSQLIFYTPSAILSEAALSFLGLGDPSIPTWGQILQLGFQSGGVYVGWWWWIVPPGLLIVVTAVTFVFLALGMEPVVNPRLRRMR